ncbi:PREDICTED: uncharacterized protein K02A2.6-like [Cyphomyrmex costatus]|uniref:uncharacterized protein K02A2.6-like n=1 Tax=Cyphomyrmex costatus TaxID=456900 RepID=UPI00085240B5|nr:PREDICTED: uncharacterized protein K02A2.6-like [Cyphomyrmex costatus]
MIVIPTTLRKEVLQELHAGHFGMTKMKGLARSHCWWPGITRDIETVVKECVECNTVANAPKNAETHVWETPTAPFVRWHIDFAYKDNTMFFICVDAFTKWPEVYIVQNMLIEPTIDICKEIFARFGLPKVIVSDNGPTFTSQRFRQFLQAYGITHKTSAPFHPASNGQGELQSTGVQKTVEDCDYYTPPDETESSEPAIESDTDPGLGVFSSAESMPGLGIVPAVRTLRLRNKLKAPERLQYHHAEK